MSVWGWLQMQRMIAMTLLPAPKHKFDGFLRTLLRMDEFLLCREKLLLVSKITAETEKRQVILTEKAKRWLLCT